MGFSSAYVITANDVARDDVTQADDVTCDDKSQCMRREFKYNMIILYVLFLLKNNDVTPDDVTSDDTSYYDTSLDDMS